MSLTIVDDRINRVCTAAGCVTNNSTKRGKSGLFHTVPPWRGRYSSPASVPSPPSGNESDRWSDYVTVCGFPLMPGSGICGLATVVSGGAMVGGASKSCKTCTSVAALISILF